AVQLWPPAADPLRRAQAEGSETAAPDLRDCDHRTLPPAGELGRGSADRDVSGGDFSAAMKRTWAGEVLRSWWPVRSILRVFGRLWASARGAKEDKSGWSAF